MTEEELRQCRAEFESWHQDKYACKAEFRDIPVGYKNDITQALFEGFYGGWESKP